MKKFMALYMASGPQFEKMMKDSTPEQRKKGMNAWVFRLAALMPRHPRG